jgi:hypothetical protein
MYNHVIWPPQYDPRISPIYALNVSLRASPFFSGSRVGD